MTARTTPGFSTLTAWGYRHLVRPAMFAAQGGDPERVHEQTLRMITAVGRQPALRRSTAALLARHRSPVTVAGITFPGRIGLAAGMDKNGIAVRAWSALGFGHAELGTVTARAQPGNDRPRLFRLPASEAIVNRMGFNNHGAAALAATLEAAGVRRGNDAVGMAVGVSIGKTRTTPLDRATEDYLTSFDLLAPYADYLAVNVSSPNTPGLRSLQDGQALRELVTALVGRAAATSTGGHPPLPIFVKLAPDLGEDALDEAVGVCEDAGAAGLIATNTTLDRAGTSPAESAKAAESGGLSGAPLTVRARRVVALLAGRTRLPIIGVGGIMSAADGQALLDAGADLLQVYTGFIFRGPPLVGALNRLPVRPTPAVTPTLTPTPATQEATA